MVGVDYTVFVVVAMAIAVLGSMLPIFFGHRLVGDTPYCRRCRYNLTGTDRSVVGARCPECGAFLSSPNAVRIGEYRRRWGVFAFGAALMLTGYSSFLLISQINWLAATPVSWLLADLKHADPSRAGLAFQELSRRYNADTLSDSQLLAMADHALDAQVSEFAVLNAQRWIDMLHDMYVRGKLDPVRFQRYMDNLVRVDFEARPRIVQGERPVGVTEFMIRGPLEGLRVRWLRMDFPRAGSDPLKVAASGFDYPGMAMSWRDSVPADEVGTHRAIFDAEYTVHPVDSFGITDPDPLHRGTIYLEAEYEVLPAGDDAGVRLVYTPELAEAVARAIEVAPTAQWRETQFGISVQWEVRIK